MGVRRPRSRARTSPASGGRTPARGRVSQLGAGTHCLARSAGKSLSHHTDQGQGRPAARLPRLYLHTHGLSRLRDRARRYRQRRGRHSRLLRRLAPEAPEREGRRDGGRIQLLPRQQHRCKRGKRKPPAFSEQRHRGAGSRLAARNGGLGVAPRSRRGRRQAAARQWSHPARRHHHGTVRPRQPRFRECARRRLRLFWLHRMGIAPTRRSPALA